MFRASVLQWLAADDSPECPAIIVNRVKPKTLPVPRQDCAFLNHSVWAQTFHQHLEHPGFAARRHDKSFCGIKLTLLSSISALAVVEKAAEEDWIKVDPAFLPSLINPKGQQHMPGHEEKEVKQQPAKEKRQ
ncbi:hypothetical protein GCM10009604_22160 [Corynebacterium aurimucosum]